MFLRVREIVVDLIVFDMSDSNIILGIDFFSLYKAEINYKKKKVCFQLENSKEFSFG